MSKHWTSAGLGLMLVGAAGMAIAQPPGGRGPQGDRSPLKQVIENADTDGDGSVSYADITAALPGFPEHAFDRIDGDGDGLVTQQEIADHRAARKERMGDSAHGERRHRGPEDGKRFGGAGTERRPEEFRGPRGPHGDDGRQGQRLDLRSADTNEDQQITLEEFSAAFPEAPADRFEHMDRNGDGVLSPDDRPEGAGPGGPRGPGGSREHMAKLRAADVNEDHQITAEEFATAFPEVPADRFQQMDRNNDGVLSPEDRPEGNGPPPQFRRHLMEDADTNEDGQISYEELSAAKPGFPQEVFQNLDANGDGVLSEDERPAKPPHGRGGPRGQRPGPPARN